jgi:hypothetical protein
LTTGDFMQSTPCSRTATSEQKNCASVWPLGKKPGALQKSHKFRTRRRECTLVDELAPSAERFKQRCCRVRTSLGDATA